MKTFIKTDYYIQIFLACVLNPLGVLSMYGIALAFPIIGLYQLISDALHLFVYKTEFLNRERTIHFYGAIAYIVIVLLFTYDIAKSSHSGSEWILFIIFYIIIPEIMIWIRFSWARKHYLYEKNRVHNETDLIEELQEV